jgi:hypothetical protein
MTSLRRFGDPGYSVLAKDLSGLLESARRAAARAVNAIMTATHREIGRRVVEFEQRGEKRAEYGAELLETLAADLTTRFGRGFSIDNLESMRRFYRAFPKAKASSPTPMPGRCTSTTRGSTGCNRTRTRRSA